MTNPVIAIPLGFIAALIALFYVVTDGFQGRASAEIGPLKLNSQEFSSIATLVNRTENAGDGNYDSLDSPRGDVFSTSEAAFHLLNLNFSPNTAGLKVELGYGDDVVADSATPPTNNKVLFDYTLAGTNTVNTPIFIEIPRNKVAYARVSGMANWNLAVQAWTGNTAVAQAIAEVIGYETIEDEGTALTLRRTLNFVGTGVTCVDDPTGLETDCTISGGGGGSPDVEEDDAGAFSASTFDFGLGFDVSESPVGEANIVLDYTEDPVDVSTSEVTGTLGASNGGTGQTAATADAVLVANGSAYVARVISDCDSVGDALNYDTTTDAWSCRNDFGASIETGEITDGTILEADLAVVDSPVDEECLTYEATVGDFEWQSCGAGGGDSNSDFMHRVADSGSLFIANCTASCRQITTSGRAPGADDLEVVPIWMDQSLTVDEIVFYVTVAGSAGEDARVGIYADDGSVYPGSLEVDCGTIAIDTTGQKTVTCSPTALGQGLHWIAIVTESATVEFDVVDQLYELNSTNLGLQQSSVGRIRWGYEVAFTCGSNCTNSLPDPFTGGGTIDNTAIPGNPIWIGVSPQ